MIPPRIVLDSNVIISGFLFGGSPAQIIGHAADGVVRCFASLPILDEIREVLQRPKFGLSPEQAMAIVTDLHDLCRIIVPAGKARAVAADPDDDMVMDCAAAAQADFIVSGDAHLLNLGQWRGIRILSPAEFMGQLEGRQGPGSGD